MECSRTDCDIPKRGFVWSHLLHNDLGKEIAAGPNFAQVGSTSKIAIILLLKNSIYPLNSTILFLTVTVFLDYLKSNQYFSTFITKSLWFLE